MLKETVWQIVDLSPLDRFARPRETVDAVIVPASSASDCVDGHELRVDGRQVHIDSSKHDNRQTTAVPGDSFSRSTRKSTITAGRAPSKNL